MKKTLAGLMVAGWSCGLAVASVGPPVPLPAVNFPVETGRMEAPRLARERHEGRVKLDRGASDEALAYAYYVAKILVRSRTHNPGRERSFYTLWAARTRSPKDRIPLVRRGYCLQVRNVVVTKRGWRATVYIFPQLETLGRRLFAPRNHHIEVYSYEDGVLRLEHEMVDPRFDPALGMSGLLFH